MSWQDVASPRPVDGDALASFGTLGQRRAYARQRSSSGPCTGSSGHASLARTVRRLMLCMERDSGPRGERLSGTSREEAELAEESHLIEEQVLGLQRVAVGDVNRRPLELNSLSCRRDIAVGGVEHTIMGAGEGPFGRCGRPVGEELRDLEAEVRECS